LLRLYRFSRQEVCTILRDFLGKTDVVFEDEAAVSAAVHEMEAGGDLADTLIVAKAREHGCSGVATFDEDLVRRHPNFAVRP
jgi:predicted nucleic-acid-binding protein